jgi:Ca-activated chloride channel family protein
MSFLWPEMLWSLLLLPVLAGFYVLLLRRKKKLTVRYASLGMVKQAMGNRQRWKRHVPPVLFLLAVAAMLVASARPTAVMTLPTQKQTIILAMDVSGSMRATDVEPNRLVAAQNAAKAFLDDLPSGIRVGIVTFAGSAAVVQPPTFARDELRAAIDRFQLQRATAIGSGIVLSLATLFPEEEIDLVEVAENRHGFRSAPLGKPKDPATKKEFKPVPPGSNDSAAIILLTDGQQTTGVDTMEAARMAAERGVRVYTVGIGTVDGKNIDFEGWSMRVRLDEDTLKDVASATQAEYFYAGTASELKKVYQSLTSRVVLEERETEVSALLALLGAVLAVLAAALSMWWFNRVL